MITLKNNIALLGFIAMLPASVALAGFSVPPTVTTIGTIGPSKDTINRGYAGLKWTLGQGLTPAVVVGLRRATVKSNGDTQGGDISFSFNLAGGPKPDKLRVKYFDGQEKVQGEVGGGYDFSKGVFAGLSVQGPYSNVGVDYLFTQDTRWEPYFMLNTMKKYDKPANGTTTTTLSCPPSFELSGSTCVFTGPS